jgi:UPF0755 protein
VTDPILPIVERPPAPPPRPRRAHFGRLLIAIAVLAAVMVLAIVGLGKVITKIGGPNNPDFKGKGTDPIVIQVPEGASPPQIGRVLQAAGVVKSAAAFQSAAAKDDAAARKLQPGYYRLRKMMSGSAAFTLLIDPASRAESKFTLPEGATVRQMLPIISKGTGIPLAALDAATHQPAQLGLPSYAKGVEGFLFPATYEVRPDATAVEVLRLMVNRFNQEAASLDLTAGAQRNHVTPLQLVTLASIIEREVRNDRGKAARVLYNRLADTKDFPTLGLDSTVRYALGDFPGTLTQSQLDIESPYNTRKHPGIPPGPIGNPGTEALQAAMSPTPGAWDYFLSLPKENKTYYATTAAQFDALRKQLAAQGGSGGF